MTESEHQILVMCWDIEKAASEEYRSPIAETTATRIGVLESQADDRHQCGIFSSTSWPPFGRAVRESRKTRRPCVRYANPVRSAHPDWRRGERNQKPLHRSIAMSNQVQITVSKKCPPWAGFVSPYVATVKVGNVFVTVEALK